MDIGQYLFHKSIYDPLLFILRIANYGEIRSIRGVFIFIIKQSTKFKQIVCSAGRDLISYCKNVVSQTGQYLFT